MRVTADRFLSLCYGAFLAFMVLLVSFWYTQSLLFVIEQIDPPKVVAVADDYVDVEWHNRRLLDCPTTGTPLFYTPLATAELPGRPVAAGLQEQRFVRRYYFPKHLLALHKEHAEPGIQYSAELRILIEARCNPIWPTQETIRVPFRMPDL